MTTGSLPVPQRSHARSNRARILATAREEFGRDRDASLDEIARAAGVARRTLYGHFPNRQALIAALAEEAEQSVRQAFTEARQPGADPATALARMTLAACAVGDRYRVLIALARRDLGDEGVRAALAPAHAEATSILERGQRDGVFTDLLPANVLSKALESLTLTLFETQDPSGWNDPSSETIAASALVAAGVPSAEALACVRAVLKAQAARPAGS